MNNIDVSVIICCHNSAKRLPSTLEYLAKQKVDSNTFWEIIVVDNNSTDNTAEVALTEWQKYNNNTPFKVVKETTPGLSNARKKGVIESKGELILFCDDDNWLSENYINLANNLMKQDTEIIMLGGIGEAVFEGEKPEWFEEYQEIYAVGEQKAINYGNKDILYLYGAGIIIRNTFFSMLEAIQFKSLLLDRNGKDLTSGGDTEYCALAALLQLKIVANNNLKFKHLVPKGRETVEYLKRWHYGYGKSRIYISIYRNIIAGKNNIHYVQNLRYPFWLDQTLLNIKEIVRLTLKKISSKNKPDYLKNALRIELYKGEITELRKIKNNYIPLCIHVIELIKRGEKYLAEKKQFNITKQTS